MHLLFCLILYVPVNSFSVVSGWVFLGWTSTKLGLMCLAQGHNAVIPVRLQPAALWFGVKHSIVLPRSNDHVYICLFVNIVIKTSD